MGIVADRLQLAMRMREIKQADLVRMTGIGKSSISTYLSGDYEPKQTNTYKLAKALRVNPSWLLGNDVPMDQIEVNESIPQSFQTEIIYSSPSSGDESTDELRRQIHDYIDSLTGEEIHSMCIVLKLQKSKP